MLERNKQEQLLDIIEELLRDEQINGNDEVLNGLLNRIEKISPTDKVANNATIKRIHEYCIEETIKNQAQEFYKNFQLPKLKEQLEQDFVKMEHERRMNDFEGFCLAMFQQVEAIVNYCFESNYLRNKIKEEKNSPAFIEWNPNTRKWERSSKQLLLPFLLLKKNPNYENNSNQPFFSIENKDISKYFDDNDLPVVKYKPNKKSWSFLNRFRAVLFYYYFNGNLKRHDFKVIYDPGDELYTIRNKNHRGSNPTSHQKDIIDRINTWESKYFLKFYGFLEDFVRTVNKNFNNKTNKSHDHKSKKSSKKNKAKNTNNLGDKSLQLKEMYNQLKNHGK